MTHQSLLLALLCLESSVVMSLRDDEGKRLPSSYPNLPQSFSVDIGYTFSNGFTASAHLWFDSTADAYRIDTQMFGRTSIVIYSGENHTLSFVSGHSCIQIPTSPTLPFPSFAIPPSYIHDNDPALVRGVVVDRYLSRGVAASPSSQFFGSDSSQHTELYVLHNVPFVLPPTFSTSSTTGSASDTGSAASGATATPSEDVPRMLPRGMSTTSVPWRATFTSTAAGTSVDALPPAVLSLAAQLALPMGQSQLLPDGSEDVTCNNNDDDADDDRGDRLVVPRTAKACKKKQPRTSSKSHKTDSGSSSVRNPPLLGATAAAQHISQLVCSDDRDGAAVCGWLPLRWKDGHGWIPDDDVAEASAGCDGDTDCDCDAARPASETTTATVRPSLLIGHGSGRGERGEWGQKATMSLVTAAAAAAAAGPSGGDAAHCAMLHHAETDGDGDGGGEGGGGGDLGLCGRSDAAVVEVKGGEGDGGKCVGGGGGGGDADGMLDAHTASGNSPAAATHGGGGRGVGGGGGSGRGDPVGGVRTTAGVTVTTDFFDFVPAHQPAGIFTLPPHAASLCSAAAAAAAGADAAADTAAADAGRDRAAVDRLRKERQARRAGRLSRLLGLTGSKLESPESLTIARLALDIAVAQHIHDVASAKCKAT